MGKQDSREDSANSVELRMPRVCHTNSQRSKKDRDDGVGAIRSYFGAEEKR